MSDKKDLKKQSKENQEKEPFNLKKEIISWVQIIVAAVVIAWVLNTFIIANSYVPTGSMIPIIQSGSRVIGSRLSYLFGDPERGDVVIFRYPDDPEQKTFYVKRVIGLPGDTVTIKDGQVYINDSETPLDESYLAEPMQERETIELSVETINSLNVEYSEMEYVSDDMVRVNVNDAVYHVPEGCYFMMGDNRNFSEDARLWQNKYVEKDKIIAKVLFCYFPNIHLVK